MPKNVFTPDKRDRDTSILEIYDLEKGESREVVRFDRLIEAPNWSRDGKSLFYNSRGELYRYDLEKGTEEKLDTGLCRNCNNDHVLSPDGRSIAISHSEESWMSRVYIVPIGGGEPRLVTENCPSFLHGWSPDGETLAYCAFRDMEKGGDIYTIPVSGGEERQLTFTEGLNDGPEYSPDGKHIWFNSVRSGLMQAWRMNADGSEQTQMTFDEGWNTWFPHISPDGKKVVMIAYKKGDLKPGEHLPHKWVELRLMNADGSRLKTLLTLFGGQGTINVNSWAPDSKRFAYVRYELPKE
ncbi:MAG: hypothetical protein SOV73_00115 [Candidatus Faecivivens sp.]|nr:hypothetical protein [Candidatus Faecivivens sp.]